MNAEASIFELQFEGRRKDHLKMIRALPSYKALTPSGVRYIESVLLGPPARPVGQTSLMSVSGACASKRFPYLVEFESAGCERPYVLQSLMDDRVLDLFSQPASLTIARTDRRGRTTPRRYTPDYLEITADRISLIEAKQESKLIDLATKSGDWYQADGNWHFSPAEQAVKRLGMYFRIFCPDHLSPAHKANLQIISRFSRTPLTREQETALERAREYLSKRPTTIAELCARDSQLSASVILGAMGRGLLFGLLESQQLEPSLVVYASRAEADRRGAFIGRAIRLNERELGTLHVRLLHASEKELDGAKKAMERYDFRRQSGKKKNATDYRDEVRLRLAAKENAPRIAAFLRCFSDRGSKERRISPGQIDEIKRHALGYLKNGGVPNTSRMHASFIDIAREEGGYEVSLETYRKIYLKEVKPETAALISGGKRSFHAARPRTDGAHSVPRLKIAGLHVHLDGVYGDARAKKSVIGEFPRPIFFPLVDDITGYVLGAGVQLRRPSRLPVLMAHRDCYYRHGFLPSQIIQDWGSEFANLLIPEMRGYFGVNYSQRPKSAPQFGGIGEMFNAQLNAHLQELAGGTYFDKAGRSSDGDKKSRATATLTVREIVDSAFDWMFNIWNVMPFGARERSPADMWAESIACFPEAVVRVPDNALSRYYTSLPLKAKKFSYRRGFRYAGRSFMSNELPALIRAGETPTNPRLDCMNPSIIHAMTSKGPIELRSLDYQRLCGATFDRLMQEMDYTLTARARAKSNQTNRNILENRRRREKPSFERSMETRQESMLTANENGCAASASRFGSALRLGPAKLVKLD